MTETLGHATSAALSLPLASSGRSHSVASPALSWRGRDPVDVARYGASPRVHHHARSQCRPVGS